MTRLKALIAAGVMLLGITSAAVLLGAGAATAAPIANCTSTTGTIIAVDFSHWGGPVVRGCDTTKPSTGYALLHDAGFGTAGDSHDGPAFICRLGNSAFHGGTQYPTPAQDPCVLTPPASAYWSYWLAPAGQNTWTYSQLGAMSEVPKAGEVELWIFGGTNIQGTQGRPTCPPSALRATGAAVGYCVASGSPSGAPSTHPASSRPATHPASTHAASTHAGSTHPATKPTTTKAVAGPPAATSHATSARSSSAVGSGPVSTSGSPSPSRASSSTAGAPDWPSGSPGGTLASPAATRSAPIGADPSASSTGASSTGGAPIVDAKPAAKTTHSAGSIVPLVVGIALVVVLAGGSGFAMWRRRQQQP